MTVLALPMAPAGSVQEQVTQQYAYLVQMAQQLNLALGQLEALGGGAGEASVRRQANGRLGTAASETADGQYETLRSMILKTADQVQKTTAALTAQRPAGSAITVSGPLNSTTHPARAAASRVASTFE